MSTISTTPIPPPIDDNYAHSFLPIVMDQTQQSPPDGRTYYFQWDTFASGFFGQSDNVVLRFVAPVQSTNGVAGTFSYPNAVAGPILYGSPSATTMPFRVRGTQVQVFSETVSDENAVSGAVVYRQTAGDTHASPMSNDQQQPFHTNSSGYLQGRGALALGDTIVALLPISQTEQYTYYHTNYTPTNAGITATTVLTPGVQQLVVSGDNPLLLFNLDISLEWDASQDEAYLDQLQAHIQDTSAHLFDLTNGQVALGNVNIYHNRENWHQSDVLIYARNDLRPSANIGGIATEDSTDILNGSGFPTPTEIDHAYGPGRVRMPVNWNRYGNPDGNIQGDWARALAHELSHYLLYLPDNYLGVSNGSIIGTDCVGSVMTDAYDSDYSEMLARDQWLGECLNTIADYTTGRTDWETIRHFYPMLREDRLLDGPYNLPLAVTQIENIVPTQQRDTLTNPYFYLKDETGQSLSIPAHTGRAYILQADDLLEVAQLLPIGSPVGDDLLAQGVADEDTVCVFSDRLGQKHTGCLTDVADNSSHNLIMQPVPDSWQPQLDLHVITTRTFAITIHQPINSGQLMVQFYGQTITDSHPIALTSLSTETHTAVVTFTQPVFSAFAHIWWSESPTLHQEIIELFINGGWGPDCWGWEYDTNSYSWQTPVAAPDGQIRIYDLDNILRGAQNYALQTLPSPPNLPIWLTPVGQAYQLTAAQDITSTRNIQFQYLQCNLPDDTYEQYLQLFYSPDDGHTWQGLETQLDVERNLATAVMPTTTNGIYLLVSTIPYELDQGWNLIGYMLDTRPVTTALASIQDHYTIIHTYQQGEWLTYDPHVPLTYRPYVNTLQYLEFGQGYWLHSTISTTLYLTPTDGSIPASIPSPLSGLDLPPTTIYGEITGLNAGDEATVVATVGSIVCGSTVTQPYGDTHIYVLQASDDCMEQSLSIWVDGTPTSQTILWDNTTTHYLPVDG